MMSYIDGTSKENSNTSHIELSIDTNQLMAITKTMKTTPKTKSNIRRKKTTSNPHTIAEPNLRQNFLLHPEWPQKIVSNTWHLLLAQIKPPTNHQNRLKTFIIAFHLLFPLLNANKHTKNTYSITNSYSTTNRLSIHQKRHHNKPK